MKTKGFTLLEFILYFAIVSIVVTAVTAFAVDIGRWRGKALIVAQTGQNSELALLKILRAVRTASSLNTGASTFDSDNGVLSLSMSSTSTDPTVFDLSGGAVRIKEGSASATAITGPEVTVTQLRFSKDGLFGVGKTVTVTLGLSYNTSSGLGDFAYATSASGTAVIRKN